VRFGPNFPDRSRRPERETDPAFWLGPFCLVDPRSEAITWLQGGCRPYPPK